MRAKPKITKEHRRLFEIFQEAIQAEKGAQRLYAEARDMCDEPALKRVLESFRKDEAKHEQMLVERYAKFRARFAAEDL
jgi:rubrerythrin